MALLLAVFVFLFLVVMICIGMGKAALVSQEKARLRAMLKRASANTRRQQQELVIEADVSDLQTYLRSAGWLEPIRRTIRQANMKLTIETFLMLTFGLGGAAGFFAGRVGLISHYSFGPPLVGLAASSIPLLVVQQARRKRFKQFEEQFAGALGFLSRSMKAGHAFTIGLEMLVADSQEPLAGCFRRVMQTMQLGSPLEAALAELSDSMPTVDVRFFVSAVMLQQGTGGNLGEILDTMADVIRARMKLKGAVKAASAHGRITGLVLTLMPMAIAVFMFVSSPEYLMTLLTDPLGRTMLWGAAAGQVLGYFTINQITKIEA